MDLTQNNTQFTATSSTNLAAEQDPADGADLTLTTIAGNDALCGPGFAQQVKLVSGTGDDNSDVTVHYYWNRCKWC